MGQQVFVSPDAHCVFTWLIDSVTDDDLARIVSQIRDSPGFQPSFNEFVDLSRAGAFEVTSVALETVGHACSLLFSAPAKRVIFAPTDIAYGISRMFQVYAERQNTPVYVVRSKQEACLLLNIDEAALPIPEAA